MRRRARTRKRQSWQRGVMNQGEQAYADRLELLKHAGHIVDWKYEAVTFLLGPNSRLTPDFQVVTNDYEIEYHEVKAQRKGKWHAEDDAKVKMKAFVDKFWYHRLLVVWPTDRERRYWGEEEIGG